MSATTSHMEGRVRAASLLVLGGLAVELVSLAVKHPLAFLLFVTLGIALVAVGVIVFLIGIALQSPR